MSAGVTVLLALALAGAWFGTLAFWRMRDPLDRLHAVTFVLIWSGAGLLAASLVADGLSARTVKCGLIWLVLVLGNACATQVCARAMYLREGAGR